MPANFGQLQDQIDEMYEEKSEDVKKMYSPQDFTEEIHKSIMRTLKKSGINPTKEAIQDVLIGIKQLSAYYDLTQEGAIEAISISAVGMIKDLKYSSVQKSSPIRTVAEAAILAKVAEVLVNKDGSLNLGVIEGMIDKYSTLSYRGKEDLLYCADKMPPSTRLKLFEQMKAQHHKSEKLTPKEIIESDITIDSMEVYARLMNGEIELSHKAKIEYIEGMKSIESDSPIARAVADVIEYWEAHDGENYDDLIKGITRVQFNFERFRENNLLRSQEGLQEEKHISDETIFDGLSYYQDIKNLREQKGYGENKYIDTGSDLYRASTTQLLKNVVKADAERSGDKDTIALGDLLESIVASTAKVSALEKQEHTESVEAIDLQYGFNSVISNLKKDVDVKTIEEALKLYSDKMKSIFENKEITDSIKNMGVKEKNAFIKNLIEEARKSESIPKDILTVYEKLMNSSFKPGTKKILKDDKSMSEYLEYISKPELAQTIKQGIEDKPKEPQEPEQPKEPQEPEQPKEENTPIQPQEAPVPIENAMMNTFMDLFGGPVNGTEISTVYLGGRESLINKEKENILKVDSMENYIGKVDEGGPVTYDDIKDRFEKKDTLQDLKTAEQLEYNEPPVEAVNELLVGPRGKKLVRNPEEMIQEEVNPMEEVAQDEPMAPDAGEAPKGPEEGVGAPEEPAEINEPETQGVEDAFETAPSENGDIGIDETIPEVEEPAEEVMQEAIIQEDVEKMAQEPEKTQEGPQLGETSGVEEAPVPAVISDRQGQLKKLSENVPMRAFREMMDNIKQKMIELKDRITGKNKNPEDRENNDDDFTQ